MNCVSTLSVNVSVVEFMAHRSPESLGAIAGFHFRVCLLFGLRAAVGSSKARKGKQKSVRRPHKMNKYKKHDVKRRAPRKRRFVPNTHRRFVTQRNKTRATRQRFPSTCPTFVLVWHITSMGGALSTPQHFFFCPVGSFIFFEEQ